MKKLILWVIVSVLVYTLLPDSSIGNLSVNAIGTLFISSAFGLALLSAK